MLEDASFLRLQLEFWPHLSYLINSTQTLVFCLFLFPFIFRGWGRTVGEVPIGANVLQQAQVPVVDYKTCRQRTINATETLYKGANVCAGGQGKGGCHVRTMVFSHLNEQAKFSNEKKGICLCVCVCVCLPACLSVCLSVYLSVFFSICLSVCLSLCLSVRRSFIHLFVHPWACFAC